MAVPEGEHGVRSDSITARTAAFLGLRKPSERAAKPGSGDSEPRGDGETLEEGVAVAPADPVGK